jgi:hypothetical protein
MPTYFDEGRGRHGVVSRQQAPRPRGHHVDSRFGGPRRHDDPDGTPFTARRLFVQRTTAFVRGEPVNEAGVGTLSAAEVKRRIPWLPPATLRRMVRREAGTQG